MSIARVLRKESANNDPAVAGYLGDIEKNGVKSNRFFSRTGLASVLDGQLAHKNMDDYKRNLGTGSYKISIDGADGTTPMNFGGRMFFPDALGKYTFVDRAYMDEKLRISKEQEDYIDEIVEYAVTSKEALATMLSVSVNDVTLVCAKGGIAREMGNLGVLPPDCDPEIDSVNCSPDLLRLLPKESISFATGVAKLRYILMKTMPVLDGETGTKKAIRENE